MGFGREARRVRDRSLPAGYRHRALCSCIERAQPIGFTATWSYLEAKVQRPRREEGFLLPALDLLEAERALRLGVDAEYARLRREQKRAGVRVPHRRDVTAWDPFRWHGDERAGARHVLATWRRRGDVERVAGYPSGRTVLAAVDGVLATEDHPELELDALQVILDRTRRQLHVVGWPADPAEYLVAWNVYRLLGQLHVVANGATPIATPWNFT